MRADTSQEAIPFEASRRALLIATASALSAAIVILVIAVLPAEYGVDPTGIGNRLGFARLYGAEAGSPPPLCTVPKGKPSAKTSSKSNSAHGRAWNTNNGSSKALGWYLTPGRRRPMWNTSFMAI